MESARGDADAFFMADYQPKDIIFAKAAMMTVDNLPKADFSIRLSLEKCR